MANDANDGQDEFGGLQRDLFATGAVLSRRGLFRLAAGLGASAVALSWVGRALAAGAKDCVVIPEETAGPFPARGVHGPDVLKKAGVVRRDIRSSFAGLTGRADGVPLAVDLTIVSAETCAPLARGAVYVWHCDREGRYSLYSDGAEDQNYLRGVQETDDEGRVSFTTIYPACYPGRWPHVHFEVYPSLAKAKDVTSKLATSQIALPKSACEQVYKTEGYEDSVRHLSRLTLASDGVFRDGAALELATITGSAQKGLTATLSVAV